jgi:hypothetical protein
MITKQQYVEYLISTPIYYTCTNLAKHLDGVSHAKPASKNKAGVAISFNRMDMI